MSQAASVPERAALTPALAWVPVWRRNLRVWQKLALPSLLANFGEPLLYMLALGYGLGSFVGEMGDLPYIVYLASGIICSSAMISASFEAMYSAYTRMAVQQSWSAMLAAPLGVGDVVLGEIIWAATKSLLSGGAILLVAALLGAVSGWQALWALPIVFVAGLCFAAMALVVTGFARNYDFFLYYNTLVITPMLLLGGVFFPLEQMPAPVQAIAVSLPLTHAVAVVRPLVTGAPVEDFLGHMAVVVAYGAIALAVSIALVRRRMSK